jgi:hypothetical protein
LSVVCSNAYSLVDNGNAVFTTVANSGLISDVVFEGLKYRTVIAALSFVGTKSDDDKAAVELYVIALAAETGTFLSII